MSPIVITCQSKISLFLSLFIFFALSLFLSIAPSPDYTHYQDCENYKSRWRFHLFINPVDLLKHLIIFTRTTARQTSSDIVRHTLANRPSFISRCVCVSFSFCERKIKLRYRRIANKLILLLRFGSISLWDTKSRRIGQWSWFSPNRRVRVKAKQKKKGKAFDHLVRKISDHFSCTALIYFVAIFYISLSLYSHAHSDSCRSIFTIHRLITWLCRAIKCCEIYVKNEMKTIHLIAMRLEMARFRVLPCFVIII